MTKKSTVKMKKSSKVNHKKIAMVSTIAILISAYVIYAVYNLLANPTDVLMVESGTVSQEEEAVGYLIREEQVIKGNNYKNGMVQLKVEGERAAKDEKVFRYYSNGEEKLVKKIQELDQKIDEASSQENSIAYPDDIKMLDKEIEMKLNEISKINDIQKIKEYKKDINKAIGKKTKIAGELSPSGSYLKKLIDERSSLENELNSGSESVTAPVSGMVSYKVDGLEEVLKPDDFSSLNKEFLEGLNLKTGQVISTNNESGKIVNNYHSYIATILKKEKTHEIKQGDYVTIRFSNAKESWAKVVYYAEQSNDDVLIVFDFDEGVEELINYRKISFDIVFWSRSGLKVPNTSIIEENGLSYVVRNRAGYLDKILVKVIRKNDTYSLVGSYDIDELKELGFSSKDIKSMRSITLYDEVLISPNIDKVK